MRRLDPFDTVQWFMGAVMVLMMVGIAMVIFGTAYSFVKDEIREAKCFEKGGTYLSWRNSCDYGNY